MAECSTWMCCYHSVVFRSISNMGGEHAEITSPLIFSFLAYFKKMKVGLSNHQPECVCPTNNFLTDRWIFLKFGRKVLPFKVTPTSHF
jgi:hypothetical protein